jgi:small nuclear ribonucleoprotein D2
MILENVKEMWSETPRLANGKKGKPVNKDRFISKMLVHKIRGCPWVSSLIPACVC